MVVRRSEPTPRLAESRLPDDCNRCEPSRPQFAVMTEPLHRLVSPCWIVGMTGYAWFFSMARAYEVLGGRWAPPVGRDAMR